MPSPGSLDGGGLLVAEQRTRFVIRAAGGLGQQAPCAAAHVTR